MHGHETYHSYSVAGSHDTDDIFKVMGSEVKVTDNIIEVFFKTCVAMKFVDDDDYPKMHFTCRGKAR